MTPTEALAASPEQLAPIVCEIMGEGWSSKPTWTRPSPIVHRVDNRSEMRPWGHVYDAFRLQDRVAELGLQASFCRWLREAAVPHATPSPPPDVFMEEVFRFVTASPLARTRAACAAFIESKENERE